MQLPSAPEYQPHFGVDAVKISGTPGCKGIYTGPARVVLNLEQASTIQKVTLANKS